MNGPARPSPIRVLALTRLLLAGEKGESRDKLRKDLKPLLESFGAEWGDRLDEALAELEEDGAVGRSEAGPKKKKTVRFALAEEGRRLALEALGLETLPPKTTWAKVQSNHLPALALGRPGGRKPDLKAEVLRARYGLDLGDRPTAKDASDAIAARLFGLGPGRPFNDEAILRKLLEDAGIEVGASVKKKDIPRAVAEALFRRELGEPSAKSPLDLLASRAVGSRQSTAAELGKAVVRAWLGGPPAPPPGAAPLAEVAPASSDLPAFARSVAEAARESPTGRFGDSKVFISHVRRALGDGPDSRGMDLAAFKARLIEAHLAGLIELGRADLVDAMDPADVGESATPYRNAVYHFVRIEDQRR